MNDKPQANKPKPHPKASKRYGGIGIIISGDFNTRKKN